MTTTALSTKTGRTDAYRGRRPALLVACGAHALHDGLTDTLYLLLPILQTEFALTYAVIGVLRALYAGAMAGLQVPAAKLARRIGGPRMLAAGTAVAGGRFPPPLPPSPPPHPPFPPSPPPAPPSAPPP